MIVSVKTFDELNTSELYAILRLRSTVFVVEQNCVYQDMDNKDQQALHVLGYINKQIVAYTRCFGPGIYFDHSSIGRVIVCPTKRGLGLGHQIMSQSIAAVKMQYKQTKITISAQSYLREFYQAHGFLQQGSEYLEDGIPHIKMNNY